MGEVETPDMQVRDFKNLTAALDYASIFEPQWLEIGKQPDGRYKMAYIRKEDSSE